MIKTTNTKTNKTTTTKKAAVTKKTPATKKSTVKKSAAAKPSFESLLEDSTNEVLKVVQEIKELEAKLRAAKEDAQKKREVRSYYRKFLAMATWSDKPYTWNCRKSEGVNWGDTAWREYHTYNTAKYEFHVEIKERKDLKKYKWEVTVSGSESTLSNDQYDYAYKPGDAVGQSYTNTNYMKNKYMDCHYDDKTRSHVCVPDPAKGNLVLEQKFTSEKAARDWAKEWMDRIIADHKETINQEKELLKQASPIRTKLEKKYAAEKAKEAKARAEVSAAHAEKLAAIKEARRAKTINA